MDRFTGVAASALIASTLSASCGSTKRTSLTLTDAGSESAADVGAGDAAPFDASVPDAEIDANDSSVCTTSVDPLLTFNLVNAAFPDSGHPDVAVHVPPGFDACHRAGLIVFFHGVNNCAVNALSSTDAPCTQGGLVRPAWHLSEQLDSARVNAILVAVQLGFDSPSSDPGQLTVQDRLRDLLHELLAEHLDPLLARPLDVSDFDRVVIASQGGGYTATDQVLHTGGLPAIREVDLYGSLFGYVSDFTDWIGTNLDEFDPTVANNRRFVDVYGTGDGTLANSQALASAVTALLGDAGRAAWLYTNPSAAPLSASDYAHPLLFDFSDGSTDSLMTHFSDVTRASGFAPLP